ncbi:MAG TPA: amylo-alpha-1,6-glucosidase, partial [Terriglobales bacterium]|nr:amylo-alpha-1,6-glucosidase [Terriglobales bacterium]
MTRGLKLASLALFLMCGLSVVAAAAPTSGPALELSRPARPWEFLPAVGQRAALFGNESGQLEAWVYPLKLFREFHLTFAAGGEKIPAESLARTVNVRPESATILYASETFQVQETLFVPVTEPGAVIILDIQAKEPLQVEASFVRDFTLEWPAALGATYMSWDPALRAFSLGEESKKFAGLVGSPDAVTLRQEYATNYSSCNVSSFSLSPVNKGATRQIIVIAGSVTGAAAVETTYKHLAADYAVLLRDSAEYYRRQLAQTVSLQLPDAQLQQAYDWARVSLLQGMVTNPYLGTGLVAGYRTSGASQRPGFAWYFGRDSAWSSFALDAEGDFSHARQALDFISQYQRADGKIPHEISQTATFVDWFNKFPYPWASADATPLFIIAVRDYVEQSGDTAFARERWNNLWKAYQFLHSTWDTHGFAQNLGVGHGWVEGGPLRPPENATTTAASNGLAPQIIKTELYQSGLGIEALRALAELARLTGHTDVVGELEQTAQRQQPLLNQFFWDPTARIYVFGLDPRDHQIDVASILPTVPMWFHLLDADKSEAMINRFATPDFEADWGARIISDHDPRYDPGGYHYGSVWPLFTGWASVGEYRYHRALPAYANLRANALLALDGSLGHVTEVLSGDYYEGLSTASPHQIWSAAMVVSPLLVGMMGLQADVPHHTLAFAPHVPAEWSTFQVENESVGSVSLSLTYRRTDDGITLQVRRTGSGDCTLEFSPSVSLRAQITGVDVNGRPAPFQAQPSTEDQHVRVRFAVFEGDNTVRIHLHNDFGVDFANSLPPLGARSRGLKVIAQTWSADHSVLTLQLAGVAGQHYDVAVRDFGQIASVDGAQMIKLADGTAALLLSFPATNRSEYE